MDAQGEHLRIQACLSWKQRISWQSHFALQTESYLLGRYIVTVSHLLQHFAETCV